MKKKMTPEKTATKKIRIPLPGGKKMVLDVRGTRILKASVGNTPLEPQGPFKQSELDLTLNGKKISYLSSDVTIVMTGAAACQTDPTLSMRSAVAGQTCVLKKIGNKYYWICTPPAPPC
jgi:hypothetical protein